ncbi:uncharacterized protein LOC127242050 [Andrographis paniculata]|uniref:uncharacterized protein LOC127242050 n=1 Tax=Andrographis paniculata TaxID=175694 RepID=UPI0021E74669|nr:uncharacterized protein LOC127242050 [Andrographis paniculata]
MEILQNTHPYQQYLQEFQYFIVIDFEATCDKGKIIYPQEIIEFPSIVVSGVTGQTQGWFQRYVRPTYNPILTDFCKELTGIEQTEVDYGVTLTEAIFQHDEWLKTMGIRNTNFAIVTWSDCDCEIMLESECKFKNIYKPLYFNRWINLQIPFHDIFGGEKCNLKTAVEKAGLTWEGRWHCGLDDAKNTARLLSLIINKGYEFSITGMLPYEPNDTAAPLCYCRVKSIKGLIMRHGSQQGKQFFGCGNWTPTRGAQCPFRKWIIYV